MALFDQTVAISTDRVREIVQNQWGVQLGKLIKTSQNHTFEGTKIVDNVETNVVVRVTPDPTSIHLDRIKREVAFVRFVQQSGEVNHICAPIPTNASEYVVASGDLIIVVTEWARGEPIDFMSYKWMTERDIVIAWGQWLARFHAVSKRFSAEHPSIARNIQRWDEMHHSILKGSELHHDDVTVMDDIEHYGVLHGDLNISNFFYIPGADGSGVGTLSVFDWDQVQQGWYLWDVAQSELTAYMLAEAGSVVDGSPVPQANPQQFEAWMVEGYEIVAGKGSVDRARLGRMVTLRKRFYQKFCTTAKAQGDVPADMAHFINYVIAWFEKVPLS